MSTPVKPKQKISLNPLEGQFDLTTGNNFSYTSVPTGKKLLIPNNMQMVVYGGIEVDGTLDIDGQIILED